jgi:secreted PhoX family phosphatase
MQSTTADVVYGQLGSFTTNYPNDGGISANSLHDPDGIAVDSSGNLYVSDQQNSRVLFYPAGSTTATGSTGRWAASPPTPGTTAGSAPTA